jgi:hypothetical protein
MQKEAIFLHAKLEGFSWGEKPFNDDFINTQNKIKPVYFVYEGRAWDIRHENNNYNLYMNNEKYSSNIFLVNGVYKCNFLSFRQGCEMEFDKSWRCTSVTYYTKKNNKEEFVAKYIVE